MPDVVSRWQSLPSQNFVCARCRKLLAVHGALSAASATVRSPRFVLIVAVNGCL
jgi:hypothetical protein